MSYQVLARKYRPSILSEVVGQPQTVKALTNAFDRKQLHHAYLFSGTRGVGKTTLARIIAKCLNCETGVTSQPCGVCANCISIANGSFVDLFEVDGASRNKVEETRELLEDIAYLPTMGTYKVYIIDEVHALSASSFQTLLKSLEEPPEHVKFVLATTNPEKVPVTVRSRCINFHLRHMTVETIATQLKHVLGQEDIPFDEPSVSLLARMGRGSMRDALSLTDQAIALCGGSLNEDGVVDMLGCAPQDDIAVLLEKVIDRDREALLNEVLALGSRGVDFTEVLAGLENSIHGLAIAKATNTAPDESLVGLMNRCDATWLQHAYQVLLMGGRDLQYAPEPRVGFEMTMLRLLDFVPIELNSPEAKKSNESAPPQARQAPETQPAPRENAPVQSSQSRETRARPASRKVYANSDPPPKHAGPAKRRPYTPSAASTTAKVSDDAALRVFLDDELPYVAQFKEKFDAEFTASWNKQEDA